ncbi:MULTISPECIES: hypothetical protein [Cryobacterium]|uniref:Uncharacterized protein n=1 Tax=Cryobacterium breve TaxID=1259258 RepID=A0ABY2JAY2_9MICO|nr:MULTISPECIES: hypothetical protein [Cryobacterium]TFC91239.1 hypothetical protein E3T20_14540 [Cryobacterium sp. TmT3-12]TFD01067.1 hypothetical protein E3O65_01875 [Cryobacterium breve]
MTTEREPTFPEEIGRMKVQRVSVGEIQIGAVATDSGRVMAFRLRDNGGFGPSEDDINCIICGIVERERCEDRNPNDRAGYDACVAKISCPTCKKAGSWQLIAI